MSNRGIIAVLLISVAATLACGNGQGPYGPAALTQAAGTATALAATQTALAAVTSTATQTATQTATATVTPTATQTSTPTATQTTTPAAPAAQSACDHPWLPLRKGATWEYVHNADHFTWTVTDVTGGLTNATATVAVKFSSSTSTYHFICDAEGLKIYDYDNTVVNAAGAQVDPKVNSSTGVWLPPAAQLTSNHAWKFDFAVEYDMGASAGKMQYTSSASTTTTGAAASVKVQAGTFNAVHVDRATTAKTSPGSAGNQTFSEADYFAPGVGIVRFDFVSNGANSSAELVKYTLP
jgi:hypothetical protein